MERAIQKATEKTIGDIDEGGEFEAVEIAQCNRLARS